jgi:uncharacterized protein (DUF1778 family)
MVDKSTKTTGATTRDIQINIRAQLRQRELIDQAAEVIGKTRSEFMLEAACQRAENILLDRQNFSLTSEQWNQFLSVLDAPVQSNEKLKKLLSVSAPWEM